MLLIYSYNTVLTAVCPYEWRQDGASYPGTEPALHCSVVGDQLQPHALQITHKQVRTLSKKVCINQYLYSNQFLLQPKIKMLIWIYEEVLAWTHRRGFLGEFSVQSVCEALDERVSSGHHHTAVQTLRHNVTRSARRFRSKTQEHTTHRHIHCHLSHIEQILWLTHIIGYQKVAMN